MISTVHSTKAKQPQSQVQRPYTLRIPPFTKGVDHCYNAPLDLLNVKVVRCEQCSECRSRVLSITADNHSTPDVFNSHYTSESISPASNIQYSQRQYNANVSIP